MLYEAFKPGGKSFVKWGGFCVLFCFTVHAKFCACVHTLGNLEPRLDGTLNELFRTRMAWPSGLLPEQNILVLSFKWGNYYLGLDYVPVQEVTKMICGCCVFLFWISLIALGEAGTVAWQMTAIEHMQTLPTARERGSKFRPRQRCEKCIPDQSELCSGMQVFGVQRKLHSLTWGWVGLLRCRAAISLDRCKSITPAQLKGGTVHLESSCSPLPLCRIVGRLEGLRTVTKFSSS